MESFLEWALQEFIYIDNTSNFIYTKMSNDMYSKAINMNENRSYAFFEVSYRGSAGSEQVVIELFEDICPKTCDNFKKLCQGYTRPDGQLIGYKGTVFDRIVKGRFIQGGDIGKTLPEGKFHKFINFISILNSQMMDLFQSMKMVILPMNHTPENTRNLVSSE